MEARPPWGSGSGPGVIGDALTRLTLEQRAGQLFMVGLQSGATPTEAEETNATIRTQHAGNVVLYSTGWNGSPTIRAAPLPLQALAREANERYCADDPGRPGRGRRRSGVRRPDRGIGRARAAGQGRSRPLADTERKPRPDLT